MNQNELKEYFKAAYMKGIGSAIFSVHGKVMFSEDLHLEDNTLKITVYDDEMSELKGKPDLDAHKIYSRVFRLSDDIFESEVNVYMHLDKIITAVQSDLIHQA